jgi:hypothetical protein
MTTPPTPTCATCRFSKPTADYKHLVRCYRNPPLSGGDAVYWPQVAKESWCGEHKPAAVSASAKPDSLSRAMELLSDVATAAEDVYATMARETVTAGDLMAPMARLREALEAAKGGK